MMPWKRAFPFLATRITDLLQERAIGSVVYISFTAIVLASTRPPRGNMLLRVFLAQNYVGKIIGSKSILEKSLCK
jgi:hypothetical protein